MRWWAVHGSMRSHWSMWRRAEARTWRSKVMRTRVAGSYKLVRPMRTRRPTVRRTVGATGSIGTGTKWERRT